MQQRLQKVLAAAGVGSRRHCEELIASGRVTVNGRPIDKLPVMADPEVDTICVDGKKIEPSLDKLYVLLYKPAGYTSTRFDRFAKHTVMELISSVGGYLYPVGRLDADTSGLLLLTNDGDFAQLITHPSHEIDKTYVACIRGQLDTAAIRRLEQGIELEDGKTAPARVTLVSRSKQANTSTVKITIHEGRKRQVRRMFQAVGHRVLELCRVKLGTLDLKGLQEGDYRFLTAREVSQLKKLASRQDSAG
ncbi:MAG: rRNA pseudouridine synthase [Candidatus Marsarchaeota archaeon]|nr:rRNA pseudouridine synthase [Candidatus Marsarchaeota archaeon]